MLKRSQLPFQLHEQSWGNSFANNIIHVRVFANVPVILKWHLLMETVSYLRETWTFCVFLLWHHISLPLAWNSLVVICEKRWKQRINITLKFKRMDSYKYHENLKSETRTGGRYSYLTWNLPAHFHYGVGYEILVLKKLALAYELVLGDKVFKCLSLNNIE